MKTKVLNFFNFFKNSVEVIAIIGSTFLLIILFMFKILQQKITLPIWTLLIIAIVPIALLFIFKWICSKRKQKFKTGDFVQIIADERKFVAIRYKCLKPAQLICKEENQCNIISVNQKYVKPYVEPPKFDFFNPLPMNINKAVRTAHITEL